jgi:hypothetical protein
MSQAIGPGDWVECVTPGPDCPKGSIWLVATLGRAPLLAVCTSHGFACERVFLTLKGDPLPEWALGRCAGCFRPIYRPKAELIAGLKTPAPRLVERA